MDWQPVDTYPKDGPRVLLYFPHFTDKIHTGYRDSDWSEDEPSVWHGSWPDMYFILGKYRMQPTHWMPLPPDPYEQYLEGMRSRDVIVMGGSFLNDSDHHLEALEKYMRWTPEDFKKNEELFVRNNLSKDADKSK